MQQYVIDDATIIEKFRAAVVAFGAPIVRREEVEREPLIVVHMRENLLINHVMKSFIERAYQYFPDRPNEDYLELTGHIKRGVKVPMASRFRGLTRGQKQRLIGALNIAAAEDEPLFMFDEAQRRWMINLYHYSDVKMALVWWSKHCLEDGTEGGAESGAEAQVDPAPSTTYEARSAH